jgi:hypothetical protein
MTDDTGPQGLDAILASAIDEHTPEPEAVAADVPAAVEGESESAKAERLRDEQGRFASAPKPRPSDGVAEANPADVPAVDQPKAIEPPRNFTAEQKAAFANLAPEAQTYVSEAFKAHEAEFTRKSQEAAEFRRTADPILQAVGPYQQYLSQRALEVGLSPPDLINRLLATEHSLRTANPQQRAQAFVQLAQQYQVDLAALNGGNPIPQPQFDPHAYAEQIRQQARQEAQEVIRQQQEEQRTQATIVSFVGAKDEHGQAKYPLADRQQVQHAMSIYLHQQPENDGRSAEQLMLDAYNYATEPYKELLGAKSAQLQSAQAEAVAKAKKAVPVKASSSLPKGAVQPKGLEGHLSAAIDRMMA